MEHGSSSSGSVDVLCAINSKAIRIVIEDPGAGEGDLKMLESAFQMSRDQQPNPDNERGRGIYLIRKLMDSSKMERLEGGGIRISMIKKKS